MSNFTFQPPTPTPPSYHDTSTSNYYEGNIQLMEARYLELCSSIRALYRSINDIRAFITTTTNDNDNGNNNIDDNNNDSNNNSDDNNKNNDNCSNDFTDAINENTILFQKQRFELYNIVNGMNNLNTKIMDVPDDIYIMVVDNDNNDATTTAISVTAAIATATINTTTAAAAPAAATTTTTTREDDNDDNAQQGFHL